MARCSIPCIFYVGVSPNGQKEVEKEDNEREKNADDVKQWHTAATASLAGWLAGSVQAGGIKTKTVNAEGN
jgi:hypothetical protein